MREGSESVEVRVAWLDQPAEEISIDIERLAKRLAKRQTRELFAATRSEIITSVCAALFFASVIVWRFVPQMDDRLVEIGCGGVMVWSAVTLFRLRYSIRRHTSNSDAFAKTGLEHYRAELLRRRDHLRSAWIWHGPLFLACVLCAVTLRGIVPSRRLWDALPVFLLLVGWAVIGVKRRFRQAADIQHEIDEISEL